MIRLSKKQILYLHSSLIKAFGGSDGIHDEAMLDSAIEAPFQTFDGIDLYPDLLNKAARLGFALIKNHPFVDGNKRTGIHAMLVFLKINGTEINAAQQEIITVGLSLASGTMSAEKLTKWLSEHCNNF